MPETLVCKLYFQIQIKCKFFENTIEHLYTRTIGDIKNNPKITLITKEKINFIIH